VKVTGTVTRRFSPSRVNTGCGRTVTCTTMSPDSPPSGTGGRAAQADLLPVRDAGGDLHLERLAVLARERDRLARTAVWKSSVVRAVTSAPRWDAAEARKPPSADRSDPSRSRPIPLLTEHREQVVEVGRLVRPSADPAEAAEHVLESAGTAGAGRLEAGTARPHRTDLVVLLALVLVGEHGVRLADLLELRLRGGIPLRRIGVVLRASLRYAFFRSASETSLATPRVL
jgi:hypothetical protein